MRSGGERRQDGWRRCGWRNSPSAGDEEEEEDSGGGGAGGRRGDSSPGKTPDWSSAEPGAGLEGEDVLVGAFDCEFG